MTTASFIQESDMETLLANQAPVVIDFTATWCGPCKVMSPLVDQLAQEYQDRATVVKLDIDQNKGIAKRFGVRSIPALLIFKGGEVVESIVGVKSYDLLSEAVTKYV
jgi:thioredoxin 1